MKKLLLAALLFFIVGSVSQLKAQDTSSAIIVKGGQLMTYAEKENTMTLERNASLTTNKLTITNAEKIIVEKGNKITVYGNCNFTFSGRVVRSARKENQPETLEYVVGAIPYI
jgi:hypothetical protein